MNKALELIAQARAALETDYPPETRPPFIQAALGGLATANEKLVVQGALDSAADSAIRVPQTALE
jgi:hypothetical protein